MSFVRKQFKDGPVQGNLRTQCIAPDECFSVGSYHQSAGLAMTGVEIHKFMPFATIRERIQLGVTLAGGVGQLSGQGEVHFLTVEGTVDPNSGPSFQQVETVSVLEANEFFDRIVGINLDDFAVLPIVRAEFAVAGILSPAVKIRASGGVNMPGAQYFSVSLIYFVGSR